MSRETSGVLCLSGLDAVIHHETVPVMVNAWEHMLRDVSHLYSWPAAVQKDAACQWQAFQESFDFLFQHLCETAHSLAIAIHHGDATAASGFAAALERWPRQVLGKGNMPDARVRDPWRHPALIKMEWARIQQMSPEFSALGPSALFADVLQNAHADMVLMTSGLLLSHAPDNEVGEFSSRIASLLLSNSGKQAFPVGLAAFLRLSEREVDHQELIYKSELKRVFQFLDTALAHAAQTSPPQQDSITLTQNDCTRTEQEGVRLALLLTIMLEQGKSEEQLIFLPDAGVLQDMAMQRLLSLLDDPSPHLEASLRRLHNDENAPELCARLKRIITSA